MPRVWTSAVGSSGRRLLTAVRRAGWRIGAVVAILVLTLVVSPAPACACSCAISSEAESAERADLVFVGVVTAIHEPLFSTSSADQVKVVFQVESVSKGRAAQSSTVHTAQSGASCGFEFAVGNRYRVYANAGQTGLCSGTTYLGAAPEVPVEHGAPLWRWLLVGAGVLAAIIAVVVLVSRRRRSSGGAGRS